jgi:hypothetical protein
METEVAKNILATIVYYDGLDYPLTAFEIWKYLIAFNMKPVRNATPARSDQSEKLRSTMQAGAAPLGEHSVAGGHETCNKISLFNILKELEEGKTRKFIESRNGFYFLRGRRDLVEKRLKHNKISAGKIKKLKKVVWFLKFVPYVRMVGVTGRLAMKNADAQSDWDLLIVLQSGRIWIGRTLVTIFLHVIGKRRYGKKIKDRVCLNYFLASDAMEIKTKDLFSSGEYSFMLPLFGQSAYKKFKTANQWIGETRINYSQKIGSVKLLKDTKTSRFIRELGEIIFDSNFLENFLRRIEKKKIENNPLTQKEGSFIEASNESLIFLPEPQGPAIFEKFKKTLESLAA